MKDSTKYKYNGNVYGKGKLVLECIKTIIGQRKSLTLDNLQLIFPKRLNGKYEVIVKLSEGKKLSANFKRYYLDDPITLKDGTRVVICSQWGIGNIGSIMVVLMKYGQSFRRIKQ